MNLKKTGRNIWENIQIYRLALILGYSHQRSTHPISYIISTMSRQLLLLDAAIIEQCNMASGVPAEGRYGGVALLDQSNLVDISQYITAQATLFQLAIDLLEGKEIAERLAGVAQSIGASNVKKLSGLVNAFATLTWCDTWTLLQLLLANFSFVLVGSVRKRRTILAIPVGIRLEWRPSSLSWEWTRLW